jgi:hypothetical protein
LSQTLKDSQERLLKFQNEVQHPRLDMISGRLEEPEECCSGNIPSFEL